jgi:capsular exopolysaccharide synthesis family protein
MPASDPRVNMELGKHLKLYWQRKWTILAAVIVTTVVAFVGVRILPQIHVAETTLRFATSRGSEVSYEELLYSERLLNTYAEIASGSQVETELAQQLNLTEAPDILAEVIPNTELIRISAEFSDPDLARSAIIALVEIINQQNERLSSRPVFITVVDSSVTPLLSSFLRTITPFVAGLLGLVAGIGLVYLIENVDTTLYGGKQIRSALKINTLGNIPKMRKNQSLLAGQRSPDYYHQAFQTLRTNILMQNPGKPVKTLLVTSANPGDGKSTIVANLAFSFSQTGEKVVIIDGDLRKPTIHTIYNVSNRCGFSDILESSRTSADVLQSNGNGITIIPSGPLPSDPPALLKSPRISHLVDELENRFDRVLIDSPTILSVPDAKLLARHSDGLLLVVRDANVTEETVEEVRECLSEIDIKPLGVVINRSSENHQYYY